MEAYRFMRLFFTHAWDNRAKDVKSLDFSITAQGALHHFREQSRMTREELSTRLGVNNSRLAYMEAKGGLTQEQSHRMIDLCHEYAMPELAQVFDRIYRHSRKPKNAKRTRGVMP